MIEQVVYKQAGVEPGKGLPARAWPGGYPIFYCCADGGVLCPACVNTEELVKTADASDEQWHIIACDINWEDDAMTCDHCNKPIQSAYGSPDKETSNAKDD